MDHRVGEERLHRTGCEESLGALGGTLSIFHQRVLYHVRDQLGDGIHTSDPGDGDGERDLVSKEDVPWDSGITPVLAWLKTVPIRDKWHESTHLENNGYVQDDMTLDCPISTLIGQDPVNNKFIEVNTHNWFAAVAKKDLSGREGDKRLCHNHFLVDITSFRIDGTFAYVRYTRTYNIQLD